MIFGGRLLRVFLAQILYILKGLDLCPENGK